MLSYKLSRSIKHALWMGTVAALSAPYSSTALAASATADSDSMDEVVVTGSRIVQPESKSFVPVSVLSTQSIEDAGTTNISDLLRSLPSVGTSGLSSSNSNFLSFNSGVNSINLRNLGDQRTLVLVNGRRFTPGIAGSSIVDFNSIPVDFIDHVEVVTGGASAIYGADAVAGVVNVIYKTDLDGLQFRAQAGGTSEHDGAIYTGAVTFGSAFADDRGHFMMNVSYEQEDGVRSAQRSRSATDQQINPATGAIVSPAHSSFAPQGRFEFFDDQYYLDDGSFDNVFTFNPDNSLKNSFSGPTDGFNRNSYRRLSIPITRTLVASTFSYNLSDAHQFYGEFTYADSRTHSQIEPDPLGANDNTDGPGSVYSSASDTNDIPIGMPLTNAYLQTLPQLTPIVNAINTWNSDPANVDDPVRYLYFRKRLLDVANRGNDSVRQTNRLVLGFKGDLPFGDWKYDASYVFGRTTDAQVSSGQINLANFAAALDSVVDNGGNIVCRDAVYRSFGCVPINVFGYHSITPEAAAWVSGTVTRNIQVQEQVISAYINGSVGELPAGKPQLVVGVESRKDRSQEIWDPLTATGQNGSNALPNIFGSFNVKEVFLESNIPILKDKAAAQTLDFEAAVRHASYSTIGSVDAWKAGLVWAPVADVRLRGVYSVAIRAPNVNELYGGQGETFPTGIQDPCDGVTATSSDKYDVACRSIPAIASAIQNNGAFTYQIPLDYQVINGFQGSNPKLQQEKAKTKTLGVVFTPTWLPSFSMTVDWFDIGIKNAINSVDLQTSINQCLLTGSPSFCTSVIRSPITGKLRTINAFLVNVSEIRTSGIDTSVRYRWDLSSFGKLDTALTETHLLKLEQNNFPGAPTSDNVGELNSTQNGRLGSGFRDRATLTLIYGKGPLEVNWKVNYMSSIYDTLPTADNSVASEKYNHVPAYIYNDVQVRYDFGTRAHITGYVGANNVFDKQPPLLPSGMASEVTGTETAADTYDVFGRFMYAGIQAKF